MVGASGSPAGAKSSTSVNEYPRTRDLLHGVAEWLLAGPQYQRAGTIRLQVTDRGVATKDGLVAVEGNELVVRLNDQELSFALTGTIAALGVTAGIEPSVPEGLYHDHAPVTVSAELSVDLAAVEQLFGWFRRGQEGIRIFDPAAAPVLWPEHFDLGFSRSEVNYGISPGDGYHPAPYAYVGPHAPRSGSFWNAPFGAVRAAAELLDAGAVAAFFRDGARRAQQDPLA